MVKIGSMTKTICLFCNCPDDGPIPPNPNYVCGTCVVRLSEFTQKKLKNGCRFIDGCLKMIQKSNGIDKLKLKEKYERKKRAIEIFINKGCSNGKQTNPKYKSEECINGRNFAQSVRDYEKHIGLFEKGQTITFYQNNK